MIILSFLRMPHNIMLLAVGLFYALAGRQAYRAHKRRKVSAFPLSLLGTAYVDSYAIDGFMPRKASLFSMLLSKQ